METKKTALISGGTGGIGGGFARVLSAAGWQLELLVRDPSTSEAIGLQTLPGARVVRCNIGNKAEVRTYIQDLHKKGTVIDLVIFAAGTHKWDTDFASVDEAKKFLIQVNVDTKRNILEPLVECYGSSLKDTVVINISSHAVRFGKDLPRYPNQEAYIPAMILVSALGEEFGTWFKLFMTEETERVDTKMTRQNFTADTIGIDPQWDSAMKPDEYAQIVLNKTGLL